MKTPFPLLFASGLLLCACGPAAPDAAHPTPPPTASDQPPEATPPLVYSKFTDPLYLAYSEEQNLYGRRTLARLWVATAKGDEPGDAQKARLAQATQALQTTDKAIAVQPDPCEAGVTVALDRAMVTKNQLERQYLQVIMEWGGKPSAAADRLDAQVHLLRDEVEELRALSDPCPKPMFDQPDDDAI